MVRMISVFIVVSLINLSFAGLAIGQVQRTEQAKKTEKVRTQIRKLGSGQKAKVKVKLNNGTSYEGYVKESNDNEFTIVDKSAVESTVKYVDIKSVGGKNLSTGAKIAIGLGAVGAAIFFAIFWVIVQDDE